MMQGLRVVDIREFENQVGVEIPLFLSGVSAGFPSPASDYVEKTLDLNEYLIKHPAATYFVHVQGDSMIGAGILSGDLLIVDRSLTPGHNSIVIAMVNGEFTVKRLRKKNGRIYLMPDNPDFSPIELSGDMQVEIWGVVTYVIHNFA